MRKVSKYELNKLFFQEKKVQLEEDIYVSTFRTVVHYLFLFYVIPDSESISFTGTLDGNGHKIYNLSKTLWGEIEEDSVVKNVTFEMDTPFYRKSRSCVCLCNRGTIKNVTVIYHGEVDYRAKGGFVEVNNGVISNCTFEGKLYINGNPSPASGRFLGGISSINNSLIKDCKVNGVISGGEKVGGISGKNTAKIKSCTVVTSTLRSYKGPIGGVAGANNGDIVNCTLSDSDVCGSKALDAGGICGKNSGKIEKVTVKNNLEIQCYKKVGGICGYNKHIIIKSSVEKTVTISGVKYIGGLVGQEVGSIKKSIFEGNINGKEAVGSISGCARYTDCSSILSTTSNISGVKKTGLVFGVIEGDSSIDNCHYTGGSKKSIDLVGYKDRKNKSITDNIHNTKMSKKEALTVLNS